MQIDPAALSRTDSVSNAAKNAAQNAPATVKSSRALISVPRLDLERAYTDLKAAIGDQWTEYKESTALFLPGTAHTLCKFLTLSLNSYRTFGWQDSWTDTDIRRN
ncbi:hypothetical protein N7470_010423 [Penicillium chermesinum]|nr:hypothetical protein N7470_010423 [Penicillium chermesinum]